MKIRFSLFALIFLFTVFITFAQQTPQTTDLSEPIGNISKDLFKLTKSVEELNNQMKKFFETFSTNQGLKLSERQQKLLLAFEILNRAEQRIANLQTLKLAFAERQTSIRLQLARITDDLLPQSIERYVSLRGTTNSQQLKDIRRLALEKEKYELTNLLDELERNVDDINDEIRQTEFFLRSLRQRLFPEINKELSDL